MFVGHASDELDHTIVAGNLAVRLPRVMISPARCVARFQPDRRQYGATITDNGGNQIGTAASPIDPLLGRWPTTAGRR